MSKRYPPEVREKAVRLALERLDEYGTPYAAAQALAPLVDVHFETLRIWIKKALAEGARPGGQAGPGLSSAEREELAKLRREVRDLKQANEILKLASGFLRAGTRPATPVIVGFIDEYRRVYGVESICRALRAHGVQIAPRTYRKARRRPPSARDIADAYVENALRDLQGRPEQMYGRRKMTRYLRRQGHDVAFCTVDRIMRELGLNGVVRGRKHRTTIPAKDGVRATDKLNRDFTAAAPNLVWVADFTYVSTWSGWAYVAFVFDAYSRAIVGWTAAATKTTALVSKALNMAVWRRERYGYPVEPGLIFHTDAGSQYVSVKFTESLALHGLSASVGSVGDAYDNALAESIIGLFKTEVINRHGPFKTLTEVEFALMEWCDWYNNARLHSRLDYLTPAEYEAAYYAQQPPRRPALV
ncbi:IS3 family transposase [Nocardia abscessus]|uniref:IS3 family transposase n=1 Tax=Nocardia abscessus TaxID=120957 RepID=A0ABS0CI36_9NOCA|nr:IS3 family transposase [Nocardia abscessus]MBF6229616.1 IS3 family transposase [Nocardia abscessus]